MLLHKLLKELICVLSFEPVVFRFPTWSIIVRIVFFVQRLNSRYRPIKKQEIEVRTPINDFLIRHTEILNYSSDEAPRAVTSSVFVGLVIIFAPFRKVKDVKKKAA